MVSISQIIKDHPYLTKDSKLPDLETLVSDESLNFEKDALFEKILRKKEKTLAEKKHLSWLRHSLCFISKKFSPRVILESWTESVDALLEEAWEKNFNSSDSVCLAYMGKLGSRELNLSSDIDLIFFGKPGCQASIREFIKEVGAANKVPSGFKLDFDLRPGGAKSPLLTDSKQLGNHLWNNSDPWERYSYARMRVSLGNKVLREEIKGIAEKFCFRRYLSSDFFHSFLNLRKSYHQTVDPTKSHIKLGRGGIRDIELFVQTFQILYGGRDVSYRGKSIFELIDMFIERKIHINLLKSLKIYYLILRQAEGLLHALNIQGGFYWNESADPTLSNLVLSSMEEVDQLIERYKESSKNFLGKKLFSSKRDDFKIEIKNSLKERNSLGEEELKNLEMFLSQKNKSLESYLGVVFSQESLKKSFLDLICYSRIGCKIFSRRPSLLEPFFLRQYEVDSLSDEDKLNTLSDMKIVRRVLSTIDFSKNKDINKLGLKLSKSYEGVIKSLIKKEDGLDLVFLGKMATREISFRSDLDFIIISNDLGSRGVAKAREFYRKISFSTVFGPLVPFDKQAGPMGSASPLVMSYAGLESFLKHSAEPWIKLMYLRHRSLFRKGALNYLKEPLSELDFKKLFNVLKEKLSRGSLESDRTKLSYGGLFHTEYITGALYLKKGVQPKKVGPMSEYIEELMILYPEVKKELSQIGNNYIKIRTQREEAFIDEQNIDMIVYKKMDENFSILESLSQKILGKRLKDEV